MRFPLWRYRGYARVLQAFPGFVRQMGSTSCYGVGSQGVTLVYLRMTSGIFTLYLLPSQCAISQKSSLLNLLNTLEGLLVQL